ncbi:MAG: TRAP transporter small permease subunit [Parvularculaceae bacterium]
MMTLFGDILNWTAAGIVYPFMLLPAAVLLAGQDAKRASAVWFALIAGIALAGALFAWLAPAIAADPWRLQLWLWLGGALLLALAVAALGGPGRIVPTLNALFERVTRGAGRAAMWLALVMALVQFAVVFMRYVFGVNYIWMQESVTYMHGALFLVVVGYALLTDDHVRVDIFYRSAGRRRKALVDFLGAYFLLFPICIAALWTAGPYVATSWAVLEGSAETSGLQGVFLLKSLIPVFALLLAMAGFSVAARAGDLLRSRER